MSDLPPEVEQAIHDHARPDVFWLGNPEYMRAWADLTGDTTVTEAAWTDTPAPTYPAYLNAQPHPDGNAMILTARSAPTRFPATPATGYHPGSEERVACGSTVQLLIPLDAWDTFIAAVIRVRQTAD